MTIVQQFTIEEAAEILHVSRQTVKRLIEGGKLRAAKIGRVYRISRTDLEAYYQGQGGGELFSNSDSQATPQRRWTIYLPDKRGKLQLLGVFEGENLIEAYHSLLRRAGVSSEQAPKIKELVFHEVEPDEDQETIEQQ